MLPLAYDKCFRKVVQRKIFTESEMPFIETEGTRFYFYILQRSLLFRFPMELYQILTIRSISNVCDFQMRGLQL